MIIFSNYSRGRRCQFQHKIKTSTLFAYSDEDNDCGQIYWIKAAERTKSRNYRLHLVRKLYFLCFMFVENTTGTPLTLAEVQLKLVTDRPLILILKTITYFITAHLLLIIVGFLVLNVVNVLKPDC